MAKLTKQQSKLHAQAVRKLNQDQLTDADAEFIFQHWHEGAVADQTATGAFFTPFEFAADFRIDVHGDRIIDLCAGIGVLSYYLYHFGYGRHGEPERQITCIERCPAFVEVGKKLLPQANWICADVFDFDFAPMIKQGRFDTAIANPPFGRPGNNASGQSIRKRRYQGAETEYHVIDLASELANFGTFIVPQMSSPFRFSGAQYFDRRPAAKYLAFEQQTGIVLDGGCGIDTTVHDEGWKQSAIRTEVVTTDFMDARTRRQPPALPSPSEKIPTQQIDLFA